MRSRWLLALGLGLAWAMAAQTVRAADAFELKVREERPRIFLREKAWNGPSVEKLREWMKTDEYQLRAKKLERGQAGPIARAVLYVGTGDEAWGKKAVAEFKKFRISGRTPSYSGIEAQKYAAMYDWLRNHPDFDEASRKKAVAHMEQWAGNYHRYLKAGGDNPFYSRMSGALGGLTTLALALHGDSPKAEVYVRFSADYLRNKLGTIREAEDGSTAGGTYGLNHLFTDWANLVAAWRSATDWDAAEWIKENQGDWLQKQLLWQIWATYPNGYIFKEGDLWEGAMDDREQHRMQVDAVTSMYQNGYGRTWADQMHRRWPKSPWDNIPLDYHTIYAWEFFVFNNPEVKPKPLTDLGLAAVFSPKVHGYVAWRSSWEPDATVVHFKCGDTVDQHASRDQGKFTLFKHAPLAIKQGAYIGWNSKLHRYYQSPWSANVVLFTGPGNVGEQPGLTIERAPSWTAYRNARKRRNRPRPGKLLATEANDDYARALGDFSGAVSGGSRWTRELVFLGYKYLLVLDRVKATGNLKHRWTLHSINEPTVDGAMMQIDNGDGRLFCKALLPEKVTIQKVGGKGHECDYNGDNRIYKKGYKPRPEQRIGAWRLDVRPADGASESVYLHVLYPTDKNTQAMPACTVTQQGDALVVTVGDLSYTFKPAK
jgi:hypothetical protein